MLRLIGLLDYKADAMRPVRFYIKTCAVFFEWVKSQVIFCVIILIAITLLIELAQVMWLSVRYHTDSIYN
jgi:hypothetical protein